MTSTWKPRFGSCSESSHKTISSIKHRKKQTLGSSGIDSEINKKPTKLPEEKRRDIVERSSEMQGQSVYHLEDDLKKMREQLATVEEEKIRALDELREMKEVSNAANMKLSEVLLSAQQTDKKEDSLVSELEQVSILSAKKRDQAWQLELDAVQKQHALDVEALSHDLIQVKKQLVLAVEEKDAACKAAEEARNLAQVNAKKVMDLSAELSLVREELDDSVEDLAIRDKNIEYLKIELEKMRLKEAEFEEKEAIFEKLKWELSNAKESESEAKGLLSESQLRVQTLEGEVEKAKEAERQLTESLDCQTKQLEETKTSLEEAKVEITSLQKKVENLEDLVAETSRDLDVSHKNLEKAKFDADSMREKVESLKAKLQTTKDDLARAQEGDELALSKEISVLRNELKLATEAEEKSKKAMDDLALVVIEVSKENKEVNEKLSFTKTELRIAREEVDHIKKTLKSTEERFQGLLDETKKERDGFKEQAERLKIEADDSILSWNDKELGFVNCIKRAEEESNALKQENHKLIESTKAAEKVTKLAREENCKLRDILKQAINEASIAKEGAEIARAENGQLKDSLMEKDYILQGLTRENESLRINEAAAFENIKELKRLLATMSAMETKVEDKHVGEVIKEQSDQKVIKEQKSFKERSFSSKKLTEVLCVKLEEVKIPHARKTEEEEDPEKAEMLKGSIFDVADSPVAPVPAPQGQGHSHSHSHSSHSHTSHRHTPSSTFTDDGGESLNLEDFDNLDGSHFDDENDRNSQRKKKALLRRFGDLIKKTSFHRREPSVG